MPTLKRTQMYFPEDMLRELRKWAKAEKTTLASIVRMAVSELLRKQKAKDWQEDPLWNLVGASKSRDGDLSVNHDRHLYGKDR